MDLEVFVNKVNMSEHCAAAAKKDNSMLGCLNKDITSRDEVIIPPYTVDQFRPGILCSVLVPAMENMWTG